MRFLLPDIPTQIAKNRIDNLDKGMKLPKRSQQIVEADTNPIIGQEKFDALLANRKTKKRKKNHSALLQAPTSQIYTGADTPSEKDGSEDFISLVLPTSMQMKGDTGSKKGAQDEGSITAQK
ncbi:hypothetical protein AYI68_g7630 [Smittium mucronatum]|uniref:Uncharacterized protein n=1 Tax=Smittium mucronatum TaxID=133383 RepID=A0A1R0GN59_9FUNG|nr:hypothetical protein AYI68_g7630 [Smittium mucronatum]